MTEEIVLSGLNCFLRPPIPALRRLAGARRLHAGLLVGVPPIQGWGEAEGDGRKLNGKKTVPFCEVEAGRGRSSSRSCSTSIPPSPERAATLKNSLGWSRNEPQARLRRNPRNARIQQVESCKDDPVRLVCRQTRSPPLIDDGGDRPFRTGLLSSSACPSIAPARGRSPASCWATCGSAALSGLGRSGGRWEEDEWEEDCPLLRGRGEKGTELVPQEAAGPALMGAESSPPA